MPCPAPLSAAGIIALELLQTWDVHTDFVSFAYILFNFAVVGAVTLFFFPAPLLMKQAYLIVTGGWVSHWPDGGVCARGPAPRRRRSVLPFSASAAAARAAGVVTAFVFSWIPEWTTWVLLVAMAVYDVVAGAPAAAPALLPRPPCAHWPGLPCRCTQRRRPGCPAAATPPSRVRHPA